jgi:two-component system, sensor histidine kinase and response regulator
MINADGKSGTGGSAPPTQDQINSLPRILVVDDESSVRDVMIKTLAHFGYDKIDTARDGAEAWKALQEARYSLVIIDHKMPKVTGLELIKKMRSENMLQPVILVSGTMPADELERNPGLRVDAMLLKPFTSAELLATMRRVLPTETQAIIPNRVQKNSPFRILVVDDNQESRQLSVDVLVSSGYEVEGANDGAAGWEALQTDDYDLVITDNQMPRMTGLEMIGKLVAARMTVPIIMATGNLPTVEFARRPWLKPDATLQKPFAYGELLNLVRNVLSPDDGNEGCTEPLLPKLF